MPFDGITVANIRHELSCKLEGGYINKIIQPERDELIISVKTSGEVFHLLLSANPSLPLAYIASSTKKAPATAPAFCMLLRKHLGGARIVRIEQPGLERIIRISAQHRNEMGDLCTVTLTAELMGKHSNIILTGPDDVIIDSVKKISSNVSSLREVLPGRHYVLPETRKKLDIFTMDQPSLNEMLNAKDSTFSTAILNSVTGISPLMAEEICARVRIYSEQAVSSCSPDDIRLVFGELMKIKNDIEAGVFSPAVYCKEDEPVDFACTGILIYKDLAKKNFDSVSSLIETYYLRKNESARIRQKSADLRKTVGTLLERSVRKLNLQEKQLHSTEKREKYKLYGELLNTYGYGSGENADHLDVINYYDGKELRIPLDPEISALENAKKYFARYNKLKRTFEAVSVQLGETEKEIDHLRSIQSSLDTASDEADLSDIREELFMSGYIRKSTGGKKGKHDASTPLHFRSSDGFDIYVGKNNLQNDHITFEIADANDWWFHTKGIHGSHVIVKTHGREMTDNAFEEAAALAAYYSQGRGSDKVEVDYTLRKNIKKPNGANPGYVIYHTNYSMIAKKRSLPEQI